MLSITEITKYLNLTGTKLSKQETKELNSVFAEADTQTGDGNETINEDKQKGDGFLNSKELNSFKELIFNSNVNRLLKKIYIIITKAELDFEINKENTNNTTGFNYFSDNPKIEYSRFTPEALKEAFPNCIIEVFDDEIYVSDEQNKNILFVKGRGNKKTIQYQINENTITLNYTFGKLESKDYLNENRTIYYENGKKYKVIEFCNGLNYYLDENESIVRVFNENENTETLYKNNQITSLINYNTGKETEFLDDNTIKESYKGSVLAITSMNHGVDINLIQTLPKEEQISFLSNFLIEAGAWYRYNRSDLEKIYNIGINLLKNSGEYTKDLEALFDIVKNKINHFESFDVNTLEYSRSFKTHLLARIQCIENPEKNYELKEPNGKIDGNFKQGNTGDCWLLATIKTIANNPKGQEMLSNLISIQKNDNELISVTVKIQDKEYVIPADELYSAIEYSTGDLDVRALEIAVNRFCLENNYKDITEGGTVDMGLEIFFGNSETIKQAYKTGTNISTKNRIDTNFIEELKTDNKIGILGCAYPNKYATDAKTGEKVELIERHAYCISHSDDNFVYIINPHDSSKTLKIEINNIWSIFVRGKLYEI